MKAYDDLVGVLQVGTQRADAARSPHAADYPADSKEAAALVEAGLLGLMDLAGGEPAHDLTPIPECPAETRRQAAVASAQFMDAVTTGSTDTLIWWARKAADKGFVAPPEALPYLIAKLGKKPGLLDPILGERGRWLLSMMSPELAPASETETLAALRRRDPSAFRELVGAGYDDMDWKERLEAIQAFADAGPEDEPILERARADKRKEVRWAAVDILTSQSGWKFAGEVWAAARPLLQLEKSFLKKALKVALPDPKALPAGISGRIPPTSGVGPGAAALQDLLSTIEPRRWSSEFGLNAAQILELADKTDYADALSNGWERAALAFHDREWIDALVIHLRGRRQWLRGDLFREASEQTVMDEIKRAADRKNEALPLAHEVATSGRTLTPACSALIVDTAMSFCIVSDPWKKIAEHLDLSVLPSLEQPRSISAQTEELRQSWLVTLEIRRRLAESLEP